MILNQEQIRRMTNGGSAVAVGGVGSGSGSGDGITMAWVDANYVSKEFFSRLFKAYDSAATPNEVLPNDLESTITNIKLMFGTWTEQYLSALGQSAGGSSGASALVDLTDVAISRPTDGQVLTYDANLGKWVNRAAGGGGSGISMSDVWDAMDGSTSEQINASHLSDALSNYVTSSAISDMATKTWVSQQGYTTNVGTVTSVATGTGLTGGTITGSGTISISSTYKTYISHGQTAYGWGNHATAGYLTSIAFSDLTSHPTTLAGYGITDAKFGTAATTYVPITLGGTTQNVLLSSSLSGYLPLSGGTMTGQIYSTTGAGAWIKGRDNALIRKGITNTTSWWPILSVKTADGSWEMGAISDNDDVKNALILSYATDENYNANTNNVMRILFPNSAGTLALLSDNVASATKLQTARTLWGNQFDGTQSIGTSDSWAPLNWVTNIVMKGNLDWRYNGAGSMTSRIFEYESGGLSINDCAFIFNSNKPASASTFPGGALNATTDWGGYSFRNVFTNNSLFENTLFLRQDLYMKTNTGIRIKNYAGDNVMALSLESNSSNNSIVVGAGAHTVAGVSTYIRGNTVNFQTANGAGSTLVGHFDNTGNYYLDVIGKAIYMKDANGTARNVLQVDTGSTRLAIGYGMTSADYRTNIYGGGGDNKGIAFYHGTTLAASVEGGDHSLVAFYHIKLTTNNQSLYTRNTSGSAIDTVRLTSGNILYFGYGCSTNNHETRIYGGATAGIGFFCGSTEVARVHKDASRQGIRIGDGLLSWDSAHNALKVSKIDGQGNEVAANFYSLGGLSGLGFTAPQNSLEAFHIDYLTSTSVTAQTMQAGRFYLNNTTWLYFEGTSLKISNGTTTKTIITL